MSTNQLEKIVEGIPNTQPPPPPTEPPSDTLIYALAAVGLAAGLAAVVISTRGKAA